MLSLIATAMLTLTLGAAQTPSAAAAFNEGVRLHDAGKPADAIPFLKQAIAEGFQPIFQARFRLARAYAKSGQSDLALAELERLVAAGFANPAPLAMPDFDGLRAMPRFAAVEKTLNALAHPCGADANYHAFDFWIGEWDVQPTGPNRGPMGSGATSVIERQLDGCVIQENWLPPGGTGAGKSFNIFNKLTKQWEQYYVDTRGTITHYTGTFHADGNLYFEADQFGSTNRIRMTFFNQGVNQVRQLGHVSTDGGTTWAVTFDLTYVRKPPKSE
ncbi:MAG: tetratricopeptide repeat protein [Acidobacteria bacterium]|nr:MAG: tetratricopeptide repeat protein [Acidobacteriota bacterium]